MSTTAQVQSGAERLGDAVVLDCNSVEVAVRNVASSPTARSKLGSQTPAVQTAELILSLVYGNEARYFGPGRKNDLGHTHEWTCYIKPYKDRWSMPALVDKVVFDMSPHYEPAVVRQAPFEVTRTGWGEFNIRIRIFLKPEFGSKRPLCLDHCIVLVRCRDDKNDAKDDDDDHHDHDPDTEDGVDNEAANIAFGGGGCGNGRRDGCPDDGGCPNRTTFDYVPYIGVERYDELVIRSPTTSQRRAIEPAVLVAVERGRGERRVCVVDAAAAAADNDDDDDDRCPHQRARRMALSQIRKARARLDAEIRAGVERLSPLHLDAIMRHLGRKNSADAGGAILTVDGRTTRRRGRPRKALDSAIIAALD